MISMTSIASLTLEVPDPAAAKDFYAAVGLDDRIALRASDAPAGTPRATA